MILIQKSHFSHFYPTDTFFYRDFQVVAVGASSKDRVRQFLVKTEWTDAAVYDYQGVIDDPNVGKSKSVYTCRVIYFRFFAETTMKG